MSSKPMTLKYLTQESHSQAIRKGWWDEGERGIPELLCLIHSEVSEALESYRNGEPMLWLSEKAKPEGIAAELADVLIRIGDLAGRHKIDLEHAVDLKLAYNEKRPYRHGGKKA